MSIKDRIQQARKNKGLTQTQLAEQLNITQKDVSRWENGVVTPSIDYIVRLVGTLGVTSDFLLELDEPAVPSIAGHIHAYGEGLSVAVDEVDDSMVGVCLRLRRLARLERLRLDETEHRGGLNRHLFRYIEYCGGDVLEYIRGYLANLQPYMIERRLDQEKSDGYVCVIDNLYRVSVYIKTDHTQFEEAVISFHEDNKRGIAKNNALLRDNRVNVAVIADRITSHIENSDSYGILVHIQRGLLTLPIELPAKKLSDEVFVVRKKSIDQEFLNYCNRYIEDLYTSNLKLNYDSIEVFTMLQQISFTSYGRDTFSSLSLLIDSLCIQKDYYSKKAADFAIVTFAQSLMLTRGQHDELVDLLRERYSVASSRGMGSVIERISLNLGHECM